MIKKLGEYKITSRDGSFINVDCNTKIINTLVQKINELVDAVNKQEEQIKLLIDALELLAKSQQEVNTEITALFIK